MVLTMLFNKLFRRDVIGSHDLTCLVGKRTNYFPVLWKFNINLLQYLYISQRNNNKILPEVKNIKNSSSSQYEFNTLQNDTMYLIYKSSLIMCKNAEFHIFIIHIRFSKFKKNVN